MKGTKSEIGTSFSLQFHITGNHIYNIVFHSNFFDQIIRITHVFSLLYPLLSFTHVYIYSPSGDNILFYLSRFSFSLTKYAFFILLRNDSPAVQYTAQAEGIKISLNFTIAY